jgi:hypothetical protein
MSDAALEAKVTGLALSVLSPARTSALIALCWGFGELADAASLAHAAAP